VREVRIDDLREPRRNAEEEAFFEFACSMHVTLDCDDLVAQARSETGLTDLGDDTLLDRLAAQVAAVEADLKVWLVRAPFAEPVRRLAAYRGVTAMGALSLQAEVCDWRRFGRPAQMMGFVGLVPTEYSSGDSTHRGHITKAGNTHLRAQLVESAWAYQHRPYAGAEIAKRHDGLPPEVVARAWKAQLRLCGRFRHPASPPRCRRNRDGGQTVISAHKNPASSRAIAAATTLVVFLRAPR
jgi:hypothetical protein